jgi:hypothetical protein
MIGICSRAQGVVPYRKEADLKPGSAGRPLGIRVTSATSAW